MADQNISGASTKMVIKGREFDEIYDLMGIGVIVESVKDCYGALGSIHATGTPSKDGSKIT